ncbi:MAG: hypothetical protein DWQ36_06155 [Acidobacteria bacterium]|nr:MAG: hypothetical protein DWQ30_19160 [Acidobacteriota bacterium]REK09630.1 MAG: hypothetical protein DWQ36_06155 [Acidobacteriota bacterium]
MLLHCFPPRFRARFGAEIADQLERDLGRAWERGALAGWLFTLRSATELVAQGSLERLFPTWTRAQHGATHLEDPRPGDATTMIGSWMNDLRHAARRLRRTPGFAVATVATLALAIGVNAGIFSVVDTVLLDPLPYRDNERLVRIAASAPGSDLPEEFGVSAEFFLQYSEQSRLLEDAAVYNWFTNTFRAEDRTERIAMSAPSTSLFRTLGVTPLLGRLPVEEDESDVVVISHALWTSWFGSDEHVVGRSFYVGGRDRTVIGVMKKDFWFPNDQVLLWVPQVIREEGLEPGRFGAAMVGRLAPGVTHAELADELRALALRLPERFGGSASYARVIEQHQPVIRSLHEELLGDAANPLAILLGAVGIVLLIACSNVANLFTVRAERGQRDVAIRRAIGATRMQVVRLQMAEAAIVALLAGVCAVAFAWWTTPLFLRAAPSEIPRLGEVGITATTLLYTLAISAFAALVCGLAPALRAAGVKISRLRQGERGATRRRHWGRTALVTAQTALALVLLIGSGLLMRSFWELRQVDPGYDTRDVFTFQIAPEGAHLTDAPSYAAFHLDFAERVAALPGVQSVGLVENVPLDEGVSGQRFRTEEMSVEAEDGTLLSMTWASGSYFGTMGISLLQGRTFNSADHTTNLGNVVVSRLAADLLWPGEDPIGRRLQRSGDDSWETVVGVVEDVWQYGFRGDPEPLVYRPLVGPTLDSRPMSSPGYVVKTRRAEEIGPEIRELVRQLAPNAPMYRTYTMEGLAADSMVQLSFTLLTLGIAAVLALVLGAIGLYGVLSYVVAERTREIGVRMAMGAAPGRVQLMVVGQGIRVVAFGLAVGVVAAMASTRVLGTMVYGVDVRDLPTFVGMSAAMVAIGLAATYFPARRASAVDPIVSLRSE